MRLKVLPMHIICARADRYQRQKKWFSKSVYVREANIPYLQVDLPILVIVALNPRDASGCVG